MRLITLFLIRFYQRFLSPMKGYSCAYRAYSGRDSCSAYGYRVIERYGVIVGYQLLQRRMNQCTHVYEIQCRHLIQIQKVSKFQTGHCDIPDVGCDPIDMSDVCDVADCISTPFQYTDSCNSCSSSKKSQSNKPMKYRPLPKNI
jgi:putative component of membrane protein insertase Oxa1/YidC/SpoIIIJ protein YidD